MKRKLRAIVAVTVLALSICLFTSCGDTDAKTEIDSAAFAGLLKQVESQASKAEGKTAYTLDSAVKVTGADGKEISCKVDWSADNDGVSFTKSGNTVNVTVNSGVTTYALYGKLVDSDSKPYDVSGNPVITVVSVGGNQGSNQDDNQGGNQDDSQGGTGNDNQGGNQDDNPGGNQDDNPGGNQGDNPGGNQGGNQDDNSNIVEAVISNKTLPDGWTYISDNSAHTNPSFNSAGTALNIRDENAGVLSPKFKAATGDIEVEMNLAINQNTKTSSGGNIFTIEALDDAGNVVATAYHNDVVAGINRITIKSAAGAVQVRIVMTAYFTNSEGKACNITVSSIKIALS